MTPAQRAALAASSAGDDGAPLSRFASPPASAGKRHRVRVLAASAAPAIRESAALAHHAPPDVLELLARDAVASVRRCVARNPATDPGVLTGLASDPDAFVRGWVAANPQAPAAVRELLAEDPDAGVRAVVAWVARWHTGPAERTRPVRP
ncbi:MAG: hypothetical protein QM638_21780 [Nocardioides sp.]|uniref:variant leucine-rich repeat-containing protein n=1 Tax=Nocardioides sp. TaxID=35761 RepID=UPI0039E293EC